MVKRKESSKQNPTKQMDWGPDGKLRFPGNISLYYWTPAWITKLKQMLINDGIEPIPGMHYPTDEQLEYVNLYYASLTLDKSEDHETGE